MRFYVNEAVIDLRAKPAEFLSNDHSHQSNRESQLLYNESIAVIDEHEEWLKIDAIEQLRFTKNREWRPYPGWVKRSEVIQRENQELNYVAIDAPGLSYGTLLEQEIQGSRPLPKKPCRQTLVSDAHLFIGLPYLWGGRSSHLPERVTSVDCSGLVNLLYRAQGIHLPRNASDQYLFSHPTQDLLPGDPLYLQKESRINHLILKISESHFIEAPETGKVIRLLRWGEHVWQNEGKIYFFDRSNAYTPYPATFIDF